jgi:hypothetical protein
MDVKDYRQILRTHNVRHNKLLVARILNAANKSTKKRLNRNRNRNFKGRKKMKKTHTIWLAVVVMLAVGLTASASLDVVTFDMSYVFEGTQAPSGLAPWVTAVFKNYNEEKVVNGNAVLLTITAALGTDLAEKVGAVYFNLDPTLDPTQLMFSQPTGTGFGTPTISLGANAFKADGDGFFDIKIDFTTDDAGAFNNSDTVSYIITKTPTNGITDNLDGLTAMSFYGLSYPGPGENSGPFYTAAHMLALGPNDADSSWITVPEPATLLLLGLGGLLMRKRK